MRKFKMWRILPENNSGYEISPITDNIFYINYNEKYIPKEPEIIRSCMGNNIQIITKEAR